MPDNAMTILDPHIHQWDPLATERLVSAPAKLVRRAPFLLPLVKRRFPRASRDFFGDPRFLLKPYLPADYVTDAAPMQVEAIVHIEAGWPAKNPFDSVEETRWISSLPFGARGVPALGAIIAHANPAEPEVADVLDAHLEASPLLRGIRYSAAHSPDQGIMNFAKRPNELAAPAFLRGFSAVAERDLSFEIWLYGHQLVDAITLAREYPDTTFVLDHYATPVGALAPSGAQTGRTAAERNSILAQWRDDISALAALPNVVAKHSGLGMPVLGLGRLPRERFRDAIAPLVAHLDSAFGPDRTFWASNYPVDKPNVSLSDVIWALREVLGDWFDDDRMLRTNARRVYRI